MWVNLKYRNDLNDFDGKHYQKAVERTGTYILV